MSQTHEHMTAPLCVFLSSILQCKITYEHTEAAVAAKEVSQREWRRCEREAQNSAFFSTQFWRTKWPQVNAEY